MSGYNSPMFVDRGKEKEAKRDTRWERRKASIFDQNNDNMYKRQVLSMCTRHSSLSAYLPTLLGGLQITTNLHNWNLSR
jgi:hypothetical protein